MPINDSYANYGVLKWSPYLIMHVVSQRLLRLLVQYTTAFGYSSGKDNFNDRKHGNQSKYGQCSLLLVGVLKFYVFF